ncbi:hypothetical protein ACSVBT_18985 [Afipia sp. TerB]
MNDERDHARQERLRAALRENLKRRKSQARGRTDRPVVTPEDDAATASDDDHRKEREDAPQGDSRSR